MADEFNLEKLFVDVFEPRAGEKVTILIDRPHGDLAMDQEWLDRHRMAERWLGELGSMASKLGIFVHPLVSYSATGANNAQLPEWGKMEGREVRLEEVLAETNICLAMTEFSATAPLFTCTHTMPQLRVASMPGVSPRMEKTALAADYREVAAKAYLLADLLTTAVKAEIEFSTGHRLTLDLRYRTGMADDGRCGPDRPLPRGINLPSGEAFIVPYEGERDTDLSRSAGEIPVQEGDHLTVFRVDGNRLIAFEGHQERVQYWKDYFGMDPARSNVAELGLGCNDMAVITGNVLEDEKVGFHWAFGRSEHLGGVTGVDAFRSPENVVHYDIVYAKGCPIEIASLVLFREDGSKEEIMRDSMYIVF